VVYIGVREQHGLRMLQGMGKDWKGFNVYNETEIGGSKIYALPVAWKIFIYTHGVAHGLALHGASRSFSFK